MAQLKKVVATAVCTVIGLTCAAGIAGCTDSAGTGGGMEGTAMNETFYNPLRIESGLGDPWMYEKDGYYYVTYSEGTQITVTRSKWMTNITANSGDETRTKVVARQKALSVVEIWAPEIFFLDGHWYIYFTATRDSTNAGIKDAGRRTYCLKSLTDDAFGEWETRATQVQLPENNYRSIDATFMQYNGKQYAIWAGWPYEEHTQDYQQDLYIAEMEQGDPTKAVASQTERIMISTPTYPWEKEGANQNEGPVVTFSPSGTPVILYSGSYSGGDAYCIGYVVLDGANKDPLDPASWTKGEKPLMETEEEIISPGHNSVVKSPDGTEDWICYHSAKYSGAGWDRTLRLQKLTWNGDIPVVEHIYSYNEEAPLPSGERVNRMRYEAENAILGEGCTVIDSVYENGDGTTSVAASGGKAVRITDENGLTFKVGVLKNGEYRLVVRYSNQAVSATTIGVSVNGTAYTLFAPKTPFDDTFCNNAFFCDLYLKPDGPNEITVTCDRNILIDCIVVDALEK